MLTTLLEFGGIVVKHRLFCFLFTLILVICPSTAQAKALTPGLLRIHVIANSNAPEDQNLKLRVRDRLLPLIQDATAESHDAAKTYRIIQQRLSKWEWIAGQTLSDACVNQDVRAEIGEFCFQDRLLNGVLVPGGRYLTLRIILGDGKGRNWWGVLYPNLCPLNGNASENEGFLTFYSHTIAFFKKLFGGDRA